MNETRVHFRQFALYEFREGNAVTSAADNVCVVYGEGVLTTRTCRKWFGRFRKGNFNPEDEPRDRIPDLVNKTRSLREMSQMLNTSKSCLHRHLKRMMAKLA